MPTKNSTDIRLTSTQSTYLDLLRALAALSVLFGHTAEYFLHDGWLFKSGLHYSGVMIFFLLSGFLISYSVFLKHKDENYRFREYFIDRFARIYCALVPALIFVWLVDSQTAQIPFTPPAIDISTRLTQFQENMNIQTWIGNLLMLQDFPIFPVLRRLGFESPWLIDQFGTATPFWTISVEWWIYMGFGLIAVHYVKSGQPFKWWQIPILAFVMITPAYYMTGGFDECLGLLWIIGMAFAFLMIKLPAILTNKNFTDHQLFKFFLGMAAIGLIGMPMRLLSIYMDTKTIKFTELQFATYLSLALFAGLFTLRYVSGISATFARICKFVADYSFSLYLTHATVISYLYIRFPGHDYDPGFFWMAISVSNLIAITFWWLFERHYRHLARWMKSKFSKERITA